MLYRPIKFAKLVVTVLLLFSVMFCELPELVSLSDNTSNDFTTQSCRTSEVNAALVTLVPAKAPRSRIPRYAKPPGAPQRTNDLPTSRDLLLLYSTFRT